MGTKGKSRRVTVRKMDENLVTLIRSKSRAIELDDLAGLLALHKSTLYRMVNAGRIPHYRFGASIRFDPATTADWLQEKRIV